MRTALVARRLAAFSGVKTVDEHLRLDHLFSITAVQHFLSQFPGCCHTPGIPDSSASAKTTS